MSPSLPSSGTPAESAAFAAECPHTHLFPGARCRVLGIPDPAIFVAAPVPVALALRFSDGATAGADLLVSDDGAAVLTVAAYTTEAGTRIGEHLWLVRQFDVVGEDVEIRTGSRADR